MVLALAPPTPGSTEGHDIGGIAGSYPSRTQNQNRGKTGAAKEDLNLWTIVARQFDKAAATLDVPKGLLEQIKACNAVYYVQFPVKIGERYEKDVEVRGKPTWLYSLTT